MGLHASMAPATLVLVGTKTSVSPQQKAHGRDDVIRTRGFLRPKQALYQTELHLDEFDLCKR